MNLIYRFDMADFNILYYFLSILAKSSLAKSVRNTQLREQEDDYIEVKAAIVRFMFKTSPEYFL